MLQPKVGFFVTAHPYEEGNERAPEFVKVAQSQFRPHHLDVITVETPVQDRKTAQGALEKFKSQNLDLLCVLEATWSFDHLILDILEEIDIPIITWAVPGMSNGSLAGVQQLNCVLAEIGQPYRFVYGDLDDPRLYQRVEEYARAAALKRRMRRMRLGMVGYRVPGMMEIAFDEFALKRLIGPRVVHLRMDEYQRLVSRFSDEQAQNLWTKVKSEAGRVLASETDGLFSVKNYLALKRFAEQEGLSGVAFECYPRHMGEACLAFSLLSDEGIQGGCEGDIHTVTAMVMIRYLTGLPVHNTDILGIYPQEDSIIFSHCGSGSFSLAKAASEVSLEPVRLADRGLCVLFPSRPGPVTMVNLVGTENTYRMCVVKAKAIETEMVFAGNPTRVVLPVPVNEFLEIVAKEGCGHHWAIGYGDVQTELVDFSSLIGMNHIILE